MQRNMRYAERLSSNANRRLSASDTIGLQISLDVSIHKVSLCRENNQKRQKLDTLNLYKNSTYNARIKERHRHSLSKVDGFFFCRHFLIGTPESYTEMFGEYPNMHSFPVVLMDVFGVWCFSIRGLRVKGKQVRRGSVIALRRDGNLSV